MAGKMKQQRQQICADGVKMSCLTHPSVRQTSDKPHVSSPFLLFLSLPPLSLSSQLCTVGHMIYLLFMYNGSSQRQQIARQVHFALLPACLRFICGTYGILQRCGKSYLHSHNRKPINFLLNSKYKLLLVNIIFKHYVLSHSVHTLGLS